MNGEIEIDYNYGKVSVKSSEIIFICDVINMDRDYLIDDLLFNKTRKNK